MARLYLVRHAKAASHWGEAADPGLDALGRRQAEAITARLASSGPLPIVASPLQRTRETAAGLERIWCTSARIDPRIAEIPSPPQEGARRSAWLQDILQRRWFELDHTLRAWRCDVLDALTRLPVDTLVFSHFVAINVAVGHALGDDRVMVFQPDHCSCTVLDVGGLTCRLIDLGSEGLTVVS